MCFPTSVWSGLHTHVDDGVVKLSSRWVSSETEVVVDLWVAILQAYSHALVCYLNLCMHRPQTCTHREKDRLDHEGLFIYMNAYQAPHFKMGRKHFTIATL